MNFQDLLWWDIDDRVNIYWWYKRLTKIFPEDYEPLFNQYSTFSNDDLKTIRANNDRLNAILKTPISTVGQANIAGLDYNILVN